MRKKIIQISLLWLAAFGLVEIFFVEIITVNNHIIAAPYFILISLILLAFFKDIFQTLIKETEKSKYLLLALLLLLHGIVYWYCTAFLQEPTELIKNNPVSFLLVNKFFLWVKPFGVLSQQIFITALVLKLHQNKVSLKNIIQLTAIFFGAAHLFVINNMTFGLAIYFTSFAIISSIIFPYQILKVKNGYLYNFMIHMAFYDLSALLFWSLS